ncbi:MAG TPA: hypothetical protein PLA39_07715 [Methanoculleus sp.]|nr:hypothetical protein [Methanoculleus sp.]
MSEKKVEIRGVEYTLKKIPPREWARLRDRCKNRFGNIIEEKYLAEVFEHLVVNPKKSIDDFDDWSECQEVADAAIEFHLGDSVPQ